jgi:hypothetical protein
VVNGARRNLNIIHFCFLPVGHLEKLSTALKVAAGPVGCVEEKKMLMRNDTVRSGPVRCARSTCQFHRSLVSVKFNAHLS